MAQAFHTKELAKLVSPDVIVGEDRSVFDEHEGRFSGGIAKAFGATERYTCGACNSNLLRSGRGARKLCYSGNSSRDSRQKRAPTPRQSTKSSARVTTPSSTTRSNETSPAPFSATAAPRQTAQTANCQETAQTADRRTGRGSEQQRKFTAKSTGRGRARPARDRGVQELSPAKVLEGESVYLVRPSRGNLRPPWHLWRYHQEWPGALHAGTRRAARGRGHFAASTRSREVQDGKRRASSSALALGRSVATRDAVTARARRQKALATVARYAGARRRQGIGERAARQVVGLPPRRNDSPEFSSQPRPWMS